MGCLYSWSTYDGEVEDKRDDLGTTVQGTGQQVVVLGESPGVSLPHEPLREDSDDHRGHDTGVDPDRHVTRVLRDDGGVEGLQGGPGLLELGGEESPGQVEGNGQEKTDSERSGDEDVELASAEHLGTESSPRDGSRVVGLGVLTRPNL